ncbi:MAG: EamA family transporter [Candidatus Paceibacterota bacterium]
MTWKIIAVIAPLFFVAYQSLSKFFPKDISPFLINAYASLVGFGVMLVLFFLTSENKSLALESKYLPLALGVGVLISLGNVAIIKAYGLGAPQSAFTSIFYPLLIVYALLVGFLFWHEKMSLYQGIGVLLSLAGLWMITYFK